MANVARSACAVVVCAALASIATVVIDSTGIAAAGAATTCTASWTGQHSTAWADPANWTPVAVPSSASSVCVTAPNGPVIDAGTTVAVAQLALTGTALVVDGQLVVRGGFAIRSSTIGGTGSVISRSHGTGNVLSGSRLDGVSFDASAGALDVSGGSVACGTRYALCLSGTARLLAGTLSIAGGTVGGPTTARPAIVAQSVVEDSPFARPAPSRIQVELSAGKLATAQYGDPASTLQVDSWDQLSPTGVLTGKLLAATGAILLPRTITAVDSAVTAYNSIRTTAGDNAYADVSTIGTSGSLAIGTPSADVATTVATLTNDGVLAFYSGTTWHVHADLVNNRTAQFVQAGVIDGRLTNSATGLITGGFQAAEVRNAGRIDITTTASTPTYTQSRGRTAVATAAQVHTSGMAINNGGLQVAMSSEVDTGSGALTVASGARLSGTQYTCGARIVGGLAGGAGNALNLTLSDTQVNCAAVLSVSGTTVLPDTLNLTSIAPTLGDRIVLLNAPAGYTGHFLTVNGASVGGSHWQIDYTSTQVVATLVLA